LVTLLKKDSWTVGEAATELDVLLVLFFMEDVGMFASFGLDCEWSAVLDRVECAVCLWWPAATVELVTAGRTNELDEGCAGPF
jgi:hypothetical protein